jgi:hypothetical protein
MVRLLETFPHLESGDEIREALRRHLDETAIAGEVAYFEQERNRLFERPYGWGWLLRLAAELHAWDDPEARRFERALAPLVEIVVERTLEYLEVLSVPVRAGTHHNTAFALAHVHDYAGAVGDERLREAVEERSRAFYLHDEDCPTAYEPSGEDFISPCLAEADLMARVLEPGRFEEWLDDFLPPLDSSRFEPLLGPVEVLDPQDPKIGHLIGLFLHRAACYDRIVASLPAGDPRRALFAKLASIHADAGLSMMWDSGYGGEHWLASFAVFHLTGAGPYER